MSYAKRAQAIIDKYSLREGDEATTNTMNKELEALRLEQEEERNKMAQNAITNMTDGVETLKSLGIDPTQVAKNVMPELTNPYEGMPQQEIPQENPQVTQNVPSEQVQGNQPVQSQIPQLPPMAATGGWKKDHIGGYGAGGWIKMENGGNPPLEKMETIPALTGWIPMSGTDHARNVESHLNPESIFYNPYMSRQDAIDYEENILRKNIGLGQYRGTGYDDVGWGALTNREVMEGEEALTNVEDKATYDFSALRGNPNKKSMGGFLQGGKIPKKDPIFAMGGKKELPNWNINKQYLKNEELWPWLQSTEGRINEDELNNWYNEEYFPVSTMMGNYGTGGKIPAKDEIGGYGMGGRVNQYKNGGFWDRILNKKPEKPVQEDQESDDDYKARLKQWEDDMKQWGQRKSKRSIGAGAALQSVGDVYGLAKSIQKPDAYNPYLMEYRPELDAAAQKAIIDDSFASGLGSMRDYARKGRNNPGTFIQGNTALAKQRALLMGNLEDRITKENEQREFAIDQENRRERMRTDILNRQQEDNRTQNIVQHLTNLGGKGAGAMKDMRADAMQNNMLGLLQTGNYRVSYNEDGSFDIVPKDE